jgi:cytochrome c oxidase assembly factor CtaG/polyferredoxin
MDPVAAAVLASWRLDVQLLCLLLFAAGIYARGWRRLHRDSPGRYPVSRLVSFSLGLTCIFVALASPLDAFGNFLLQVHMIQHLLLLMIAPPLIWIGQPVLAFLRGIPRSMLKDGLGPFLMWPALRRFGRAITHPVVCWAALAFTIIFWHIPRFYELGLRSQAWHEVQHACFFSAAMLFWWPVIQVWPSHARWPRGAMIPYLIAADVVNTALSAFLSFSDHVVYPSYLLAPRLAGITALDDQSTAGVIMWVPGSIAFLLPAVILTVRLFSPTLFHPRSNPVPVRMKRRESFPRDFLQLPIVRHRYFRRAAQTVMLLIAGAIVADGLFGSQISPMNLAGVLPWTYWRGFAVIALLAAGNLFCMACPFTLPRDLGRRFLPARHRWPHWLRSKWIAIGLLAAYLWAYEAFHLWDSPWWTAWIVIGYFATAFVIDGLFQGASFCKYVCPIGQFHFVQSLVSPLEIKVKQPQVCNSCETHDCLHGNQQQRGCELHLFQPTKHSNFDCTFCLDCVHACPQDNVGLLRVTPASTLIQDRRLYKRADVIVLASILTFGAFINAAGMTGPVMMWMSQWGGMRMVYYAAALFLFPALLLGLSRSRESAGRFTLALVPLGFSMWVAHFLFHLLTGWNSIIPIFRTGAFTPASTFSWLPPLEILTLDGGLLLTLYIVWRIAQGRIRTVLPWATLAVALYCAGVWILSQPMQMRGMVMN